MTVEIKTTYENVDEKWLAWYLERLSNEQVLPGSTAIADELRTKNVATFSSQDPCSNVVASNQYVIRRRGE